MLRDVKWEVLGMVPLKELYERSLLVSYRSQVREVDIQVSELVGEMLNRRLFQFLAGNDPFCQLGSHPSETHSVNNSPD